MSEDPKFVLDAEQLRKNILPNRTFLLPYQTGYIPYGEVVGASLGFDSNEIIYAFRKDEIRDHIKCVTDPNDPDHTSALMTARLVDLQLLEARKFMIWFIYTDDPDEFDELSFGVASVWTSAMHQGIFRVGTDAGIYDNFGKIADIEAMDLAGSPFAGTTPFASRAAMEAHYVGDLKTPEELSKAIIDAYTDRDNHRVTVLSRHMVKEYPDHEETLRMARLVTREMRDTFMNTMKEALQQAEMDENEGEGK